ncbi:MAG TPA: hypothetical protein DIS73_04075, partial [Planctomycetia bacterium]|nr:hypothetical protein [Planctomycetia bacterium]
NTNIGITSYKAVYFSAPAAYYKTLIIGGVTVHDSDSNKLGSGETATFSAITIAGGTGVSDTLPTLIQSPVTTAGDIIPIGQLGRGQTKQIKMLNFRDSPTGGGQAVSMSGVPMEITFSDGSIVRFIPF